MTDKILGTYAEAHAASGLSEKTWQRKVRAGEVRAKKFGRGVRLVWEDVLRVISELPDAFPEATESEAA